MAANQSAASTVTTAIHLRQKRPDLALLCSVRCPGKLILAAYDLMRTLTRARVSVIGGFHSPMEQECLRILLQSPNRIVWCLARGKLARTPVNLQKPVTEGRLQIIAPFSKEVRRITAATSAKRNRIVTDMAEAIVVVYAAPGGKTDILCRELLVESKPVYTFDHPANADLLRAGAKPMESLDIKSLELIEGDRTAGENTLVMVRSVHTGIEPHERASVQ